MQIATEQFSRIEKLRLIEQLWDELARAPGDLASPDWHADALRESEQAVARGDAGFVDWDEAKTRLRQGRA